MADVVDQSYEQNEPLLAADINVIRRKANAMPKGIPGECDMCGEYSGRLILCKDMHACARCRDKHRLK